MGKKKDRPLPEKPADAPAAETFDMVFHCQLAHGSRTKQVRDFTNVKQLYESIASAFEIQTKEILYCTLNTHKVDMTRLLGGQIGLDDFLFAHVRGEEKTVNVNKDGPALGLTISDNGAGYAFIKKIREDSIMSRVAGIGVGDHIQKINGTSLEGCRHFEVARMLKEIPIGSQFTITRVSPMKAFDEMAKIEPRAAKGGTSQVGEGGGKKTVRMRRDGPAQVEEEASDDVKVLITKVDDLLEQHVGIRDDDLSQSLYEYCRDAKDQELFAGALDSNLPDFEFPDDFVLDVWDAVRS